MKNVPSVPQEGAKHAQGEKLFSPDSPHTAVASVKIVTSINLPTTLIWVKVLPMSSIAVPN